MEGLGLLISVCVAAAVALIVYFVATALVSFAHSTFIFGLLCLALFLMLIFGASGKYTGRGRFYGRS